MPVAVDQGTAHLVLQEPGGNLSRLSPQSTDLASLMMLFRLLNAAHGQAGASPTQDAGLSLALPSSLPTSMPAPTAHAARLLASAGTAGNGASNAASPITQLFGGVRALANTIRSGASNIANIPLPFNLPSFLNTNIESGLVGAEEAFTGASTAGTSTLGNLLAPIGALANVGLGAFNLAQGNIPAGVGGLAGTGIGAAIGSIIPGIGTLLGAAIGGGAGGFLGGLWDSGPSKAWQSFGPRLAETLTGTRQAASDFVQSILGAKTPEGLEEARQTFLRRVEESGVGGFASRGMPPGWVVPELPGATGTAHEGGALWNPNAFNSYLNQLYSGTLQAIQNQSDPMAFQQSMIPLLQWAIQAPGGNSFPTSSDTTLAFTPTPSPPPDLRRLRMGGFENIAK